MALRNLSFTEDNFYHIYNRGNSKQQIFFDYHDYERFASILYSRNGINNFRYRDILKKGINPYDFNRGKPLVDIYSWVLMPNHFHLLIKPIVLDTGLACVDATSTFMQKLLTSYSMYFNTKYSRTGSLFEGKFKAQLVDNDNYLQYMFSYIHLNSVKLIQSDWKENGIKDQDRAFNFASSYNYSSLKDWQGFKRQENKIITKGGDLSFLPKDFDFSKELIRWLSGPRTVLGQI